METARRLHYPAAHGNTTDRRPPARMAPAPAPEPARFGARSRDFDQAPELPRNRPRAAFARHGAETGRTARRPAARAQRAAGVGRLRAGVSAAPARRPGAAARAQGGRLGAQGSRALSGDRD